MIRSTESNIRHGLSLIEVLVALAVFLMSYVAIWQLMNLAGDEAVELSYRNQATRLARSKLAEIAAGVEPMQGNGDTPFDDPDGEYSWSAEVEAGAVGSLQTVSLTVTRKNKDGSDLKVTITEMIVNPTNLGSTQDVQATPLMSTPSASSSSSGSSSSSTGSTGSTTKSTTTGTTGSTGGTTKSSTTKTGN